jgi:MYXO-CTERM domain-containing protein
MRSSSWVALAVVLSTARLTEAQCVFHTDYYAPKSPGLCTAETSVPVGCPIHVIVPPDSRPERYAPTVGSATVSVAMLGVLAIPSSEVDVNSCDCATVSSVASFDQLALTIAGLHAGDSVGFADDEAADNSYVAITAGGPCPAPVWPSSMRVAARCDLCPTPNPPPAPVDPPHGEGASAGCSSAGGGSWLVGLAVLGVLARRARRRSR